MAIKYKFVIALLLALALEPGVLYTQCDTNFVFDSQSSIDDFAVVAADCDTIRGDVFIRGEDITNLEGLMGIRVIDGYLVVEHNSFLKSFKGLENLQDIGKSLIIRFNVRLANLQGLNRLRKIGLHLSVENNDSLTSFLALSRLETLGGSLRVLENSKLRGFQGLEKLQEIAGMIDLCHNISIQNFEGLNHVKQIRGNFYAYHHDALIDFTGLDALESIGREFDIFGNDQLTSLQGLNALQSVADCLYIFGNKSLTNIEALSNLDHIGGILTIIRNSNLDTCAVLGICHYLEDPPGSVSIWENGVGCSSAENFTNGCQVLTQENNYHRMRVRVYPNPTTDVVHIEQDFCSHYSVRLTDIYGKTLQIFPKVKDDIIDLKAKGKGTYILQISCGEYQAISRLVKY